MTNTLYTIRCKGYDLGLFVNRESAELYAHLSYGAGWRVGRTVVAV